MSSSSGSERVGEGKGEEEDGSMVYEGNCHCGAVRYRVLTRPLEEVKVMSCNCSLCSRVRLFLFS